jgi:hypothetical protein
MYPDVIARDDNGKVVRKLGHEFYAKHSVRAAPRRAAQSIRRQPLVAHLLRPRSAGDAGWLGRRCGLARPAMRAGTAGVGPPAHRPGAPVAVKLLTRVTALALALSRARAHLRARAHPRGCRRWRQRTRWRRQAPASSSCAIRCNQSHAFRGRPYHVPRGTSASSWGVL